jgi:hypothetical protein
MIAATSAFGDRPDMEIADGHFRFWPHLGHPDDTVIAQVGFRAAPTLNATGRFNPLADL